MERRSGFRIANRGLRIAFPLRIRNPRFAIRNLTASLLLVAALGCGGNGDGDAARSETPQRTSRPVDSGSAIGPRAKRNDLDAMQRVRIQVKDHDFEVWVASGPTERELGLMQVRDEELTPLPDGVRRGMLFVFPDEQPLSFWMYNTVIPLDIAYIRGDGEIVRTYTMAPLETRTYPSFEAATYALEMSAGLLNELGIGPGDHVEIPPSILKDAQ
jgi:hypothetical protein